MFFLRVKLLQINRRVTTIIDGNPLKSKTAGQTDGTYGTRGGVAPSPMSEVNIMNKESVHQTNIHTLIGTLFE